MANRSADSDNNEWDRFNFKLKKPIGKMIRLLSQHKKCTQTDLIVSLVCEDWIRTEKDVKRTLGETYEDIEEFLKTGSKELTKIARQSIRCDGGDESCEEEEGQSEKKGDKDD